MAVGAEPILPTKAGRKLVGGCTTGKFPGTTVDRVSRVQGPTRERRCGAAAAQIELHRRQLALESRDGTFDRGEEKVTELFEECAVLQVMVDQARRPSDGDRHPELLELKSKTP